jgi:predicted metal-binding protein
MRGQCQVGVLCLFHDFSQLYNLRDSLFWWRNRLLFSGTITVGGVNVCEWCFLAHVKFTPEMLSQHPEVLLIEIAITVVHSELLLWETKHQFTVLFVDHERSTLGQLC